jgi:hypothetical protein
MTSPASCRRTEITPVLLGLVNGTTVWPFGRVHGDRLGEMPFGVVDRHPQHGGRQALQAVVAAERDGARAAGRNRDDGDGVRAVVELT